MTYYWLYGRLDVHVGATDADLMDALGNYADAHVIGGSAALTDEHRAGIRREHADARETYAMVAGGRF